ncbi:trans-aconitate 2-methyltransferase [Methylosinus sp. LW4]|uniref:trans-aconitate 2-methyltransferase n=1 Tax=Methylosinus sp. LW4 TaxID=136993 RepID=UPI00035C1F26|nr:trans-aconitate 2-methyltransferase [Methylosinus sp. LW4]
MADWNALLYSTFETERTRPARELLARIPLEAPGFIIDLGCGPGNSAELLAGRFPTARLLGVDSSPDMIAAARARLPAADFALADIADFRPDAAPDLLFANASLQWLPDHRALLPRLVATLAPGGVLAMQMPDNQDEPSHRLMREAAAAGPWAQKIGDASAVRTKIFSAEAYYDLLHETGCETDVWRTTYAHPLAGADAIVEWVRATGLRPFLAPLTEEEARGFVAAYRAALADAYPRRADGKILLLFPRLFIVARRK